MPGWVAREVVLPWAVTRLLLTAIGLAASHRDVLAIWSDWDAGWYLNVAQHGYTYQPGAQSTVAFAPGLPLLMHVAGVLTGRSDDGALMLSGVIASNAGLLIALIYLRKLVACEVDVHTAQRAVLYLLVWPSTLFLSAVYPHSLFLAAAIGAFYYARTGRWWWAGALGGFAALVRTDGALLVVPLAVEYVSQKRHHADALALLLVPAGWLPFAVYLFARFGSAAIMFGATEQWERHLAPPWQAFGPYFTQGFGPHGSNQSPLDLAFALIYITLVILTWRRLRASLAVYATTFLVPMLSTGLLVSTMRYGLELFPIFVVLALSGRYRLFHWSYLVLASAAAARFMAAFASSQWVA